VLLLRLDKGGLKAADLGRESLLEGGARLTNWHFVADGVVPDIADSREEHALLVRL